MKKISFLFVSVVMIILFAFTAGAVSECDLTFELNDDGNSYYVYSCDESAEGELVIPATYNGKAVTAIGDYAFYYCGRLTSITIPDGVTSIGYYAFKGCEGLTSITIPDSVTSIGEEAFYNTSYYNNVSNWSNKVLYIGNHLIRAMASITSCDIKHGTKTIAAAALNNCKSLISITIPDSVTTIGASAFSWCESLIDIKIPDSVTMIGGYAFYFCGRLTSITIPDSVTTIGDYAFYYCGRLTSITIPNSVTTIGDNAFYNCTGLKSIMIPDSVRTIGDGAFFDCESLTSITISASLENIGSYAFKGTNLKYVFYGGTEEKKNRITLAFDGNDRLILDAVWHYQAEGHSYDSYTIKGATCTDNGFEERTCSVCDYAETKTVVKLGHEYSSTYMVDTEATCTTVGEKSQHCLREGCTGRKNVTYIPASDHAFGLYKIIKVATCLNEGIIQRTCSVCAYAESASLEKIGHTEVISSAVAPTCTKTGLTEGKKCTVCNTVTVAQKTVAKKAHTNKTAVTVATLSADGKTETKCSVCGTVSGTTVINKAKTVKLSKTTFTYNGKTQTPSVTVKDSKGKALKNGTDYTVTYPKKRKSIGKYTVTVTFKGNYSGTKKLTFEIVPAKATLSKLTAGSKQFTATWKTVSGATGYEVVYSTSKKFTKKTTKTVAIKKAKTKKTTIKKLSKGKEYYVKVRAYKTVSGKKIYGAYSSVKNIKIK